THPHAPEIYTLSLHDALPISGSDADTVGNPVSDVLNFFQSGGNSVTFVGGATHQVIGCTLPVKPASATLTVPSSTASAGGLQKRSEEHTSELQSRFDLVCRLL